jgi:SnoaL-like domain
MTLKSLANPSRACEPASRPNASTNVHVAELLDRSAAAHGALMRSDLDTYRRLITFSDDFSLMSPFGGEPTFGADLTPQRMGAIVRQFRNGSFEQELVQAYATRDLVVLALVERQNVEVGGLPAQDWPLRVTLVYQRMGNEWQLAHRHADPLVRGISLEQAAALALGKAS